MYILDRIREEGHRRGLSQKTIDIYCYFVQKFFTYCRKPPKSVNKEDIRAYLNKLIKKGASGSTLNVHLNALKFLYHEIFNKKLMTTLKFSKIPKSLPTVLTKDEVQKLINVIENPKHKLIIKLLYSAGLRVGEAVRLKPENLELELNYGWIRRGKGNKDRLFIIAKAINDELKQHISKYCNSDSSWVFASKEGHLTIRCVQVIIKKAARHSRIKKNVHTHTLGHSFATHLIENGYDIGSVQSLLGHESSQTTMRYIHMATKKIINVESPLDSLR